MTAARILSRKDGETVTIKSNATISQAIDILSENNIGAVVVSDDGHTVSGILSERDIVHGLKRSGASLLETGVADIMTTNPIQSEEYPNMFRDLQETYLTRWGEIRFRPKTTD